MALDPSQQTLFYIVMAGTHQIWGLDIQNDRCFCLSGSGAEGNANGEPGISTWAQPSGISLGSLNNELSFFVADSESSAVRAISLGSKISLNVAGACADDSELFDFGDVEGVGYEAKLQHP